MKWAWIPALLIGFAAGYVAFEWTEEPKPTASTRETPASTGSADADDPSPDVDLRELDRLRREIARANARADDLARQLEQSQSEPVAAVEPASAGTLIELERARGSFDQLLARGDLEGLWLLGADLMAQGEPGYQKLHELMALFEAEMENPESPLRALVREEGLVAGRFFRALTDHHEELLRYGLYLRNQNPDQLPEIAIQLRREMVDDVGPALLGYYQGDDVELLNGYVDWVRDTDPNFSSDEVINTLAQIPTEEATTALIDYVERSSSRLDDAVRALAWQRNPRAIPVLENLRRQTEDPRMLQLIDIALRTLR